MHTVAVILALAGCAFAGPFGFGNNDNSNSNDNSGSNGMVGSLLSPVSNVVSGAGKLVGGVFGGAWGAIMPDAMNKAAINAACGNSFDKSASTNAGTGASNMLGTAVGTVWSAVVPKSVNQGSIQGANTMGKTGKDECNDYKTKIDFTATANLIYSSSSDRDRLLQAILSAWSNGVVDKKQTAGLTIYFVSEKPVGRSSAKTVTYRIVGLAKNKFNLNSSYTKFQGLFNQSPPQGIKSIGASANSNV